MIRYVTSIGLLLWALNVIAAEQILHYHSDVVVQADATVMVAERIRVRAERTRIRQGIYRDIPTRYQTPSGSRVEIPLEVLDVKRDGEPEGWHTEYLSNGIRIYVGREGVYLDEGIYEYQIRYKTDRQIGYFDDFDEIYWNVTGLGWIFPIAEATATVRLPESIPQSQLQIAAYTGPEGSQATDVTWTVVEPGVVEFATTSELDAYEGLTIAVGFPKGVVREPTAAEKRLMFLQDNAWLLIAIAALILLSAWWYFVWLREGRDPASGPIFPLYTPPEGYSPGMLRYVWKNGYDTKCFTAALIHMATRGVIELNQVDGDYTARRRHGTPTIHSEKRLYLNLLSDSVVKFEKSNRSIVSGAIAAHSSALSAELEGRYFKANRSKLVSGLPIALLVFLAAVMAVRPDMRVFSIPITFMATFAFVGCIVIVNEIYRAWRDRTGILDTLKWLFSLLKALPFLAIIAVIMFALVFIMGPAPGTVVLCLFALIALFYQLIKAPTPEGRALLDKIEGLRLYLGVAEKEDLERVHAEEPPKTLEQFELLLPYAVALNCADTWAEKFESEIEAARQSGQLQSRGWYSAAQSSGGEFTPASLSRGLSSGLSSAVSSSSRSPGSSSGSSGGGSSGGGGGGGGGGGW